MTFYELCYCWKDWLKQNEKGCSIAISLKTTSSRGETMQNGTLGFDDVSDGNNSLTGRRKRQTIRNQDIFTTRVPDSLNFRYVIRYIAFRQGILMVTSKTSGVMVHEFRYCTLITPKIHNFF